MSEEKFEAAVEKAAKIAVAAAEGDKAVITEARAERHRIKKQMRAQREKALATKLAALPDKKYAVILADSEWKFETWSEKGLDATSADNHYPTSVLDDIKKRDVPSIAAKDCVLFSWTTVPFLQQALEVMTAWGFKYVSHFAWHKRYKSESQAGTGYWNCNKHELLLIGTRGHIPAPAEGTQFESIFEAAVLELTDYSLEDIAQTVRSTLEPLAADKKLAFKVEVAPKLPAGHGDGRRLTQVLPAATPSSSPMLARWS